MNPQATWRDHWRIIWALARKDILYGLRNGYILFSLGFPLGMLLLTRFIFPSSGGGDVLRLAAYDPGNSRFVAALDEQPQMEVTRVDAESQLEDALTANVAAGLTVPAGFDAAVEAGEQPELAVRLAPGINSITIQAVKFVVEQQVWALSGVAVPAQIEWSGLDLSDSGEPSEGLTAATGLTMIWVIMGLVMTGIYIVPLLMIEEKEKHTLEVLLLSPASAAQVVTGKGLAGLFYCVANVGFMMTLTRGWVGDWPATMLALVLGSVLMVMVGLLLGGVFSTMLQINTWASLILLVLLLPSWISPMATASPIAAATRLIPTHYLVDALTQALGGTTTAMQLGRDISILAASVLVAFSGVVWTLRRQE